MKRGSKREPKALSDVMTCFECGQDAMTPGVVCLEGDRLGETYPIRMGGYRCQNCGFETIDSNQSAEFTRLLSDAYQHAHGLLSSTEIRERRARLGMNQQQFAAYLGTGPASVKRWESGQVQERAMDELIRLKTDPGAARKNLRNVEQQFPEAYVVFEGNAISLTMAVGATVYVEQSPMRIETASIPRDDEADIEVIAA